MRRYCRAPHLAAPVVLASFVQGIRIPRAASIPLAVDRDDAEHQKHRIDRPYTPITMRIASTIVGVMCLLVGCIWFLQGINVLPGSFMTGQTKWAVYGAVVFIVGIGLLAVGRRRRV